MPIYYVEKFQNRFQILILQPKKHIFKKEKVPFSGIHIFQNYAKFFGKISVITCIFYLFIFSFDRRIFRCRLDSKSTIGFRRPHVVFELWRFKITRIFFSICKKI